MAAQNEQLKRINEKVQLLLKRMVLLEKENEKLKEALQTHKSNEAVKDSQLNELLLRTEVLKATKSKLTGEEKKSLEKKINQYVREIDRCIALLQT